MKTTPLIIRKPALGDIKEIVGHYNQLHAFTAAIAFIDSLEETYVHISTTPKAGSIQYGQTLNWPNLRSWKVARYPYLIFYVVGPDHVDVWRVIHGQRNIPETLANLTDWFDDPDT